MAGRMLPAPVTRRRFHSGGVKREDMPVSTSSPSHSSAAIPPYDVRTCLYVGVPPLQASTTASLEQSPSHFQAKQHNSSASLVDIKWKRKRTSASASPPLADHGMLRLLHLLCQVASITSIVSCWRTQTLPCLLFQSVRTVRIRKADSCRGRLSQGKMERG